MLSVANWKARSKGRKCHASKGGELEMNPHLAYSHLQEGLHTYLKVFKREIPWEETQDGKQH